MAAAYHGSSANHLQPPSAATSTAAMDGSGTSTYRWAPVIQAKGQARKDMYVPLRACFPAPLASPAPYVRAGSPPVKSASSGGQGCRREGHQQAP